MTKRNALLLVAALSLFTRFFYLDHPNQVVFDEVHWGKYVTAYAVTGENFFDVHPPHGKLAVAFLLKIFGYDGSQDFSRIGLPFTQTSPIVFRFLSAFTGALIPPAAVLLLLEFGVSIPIALLGGMLLVLDNALLLQSRVMGLYPMLLLAFVLSLLFYLKGRHGKRLSLVLSGAACGFAVGFQFTGILALGAIVVFEFLLGLSKASIKRLGTIFAVALAVYTAGWILHFSLLPKPGPGDAFYVNTGNFFVDTWKLHEHMYRASATLKTPHPEASRFWSWPLMTTPIFYWKGNGASLYFLGNPATWWGTTLLFLGALAISLRRTKRKRLLFSKEWRYPQLALFAVYLMAYLPLTLMGRVLFLYHYLTPLTYSMFFALVVWDDRLRRFVPHAIAIAILGFLWLLPISYGISMPEFYWRSLLWRLWH